jgi:O-antigen/teichoic acid export membrane protein
LWSPSLAALRGESLYAADFLAFVVAVTLGEAIKMAFVARRQAGYTLLHTCVVNGGRLALVAVLAGLGAVGLVGSVALAVALAVALSLCAFLPRAFPGYRPFPEFAWSDLMPVISYSAGNYVSGLLVQSWQMVLPLIVLEVLGPASGGHSYVAWMLGSLLSSPGLALAVSAFAEGSNAPQKLSTIISRSTALGLALTVPAALCLAIAAPWVLGLFGPTYAQEGTELLRWLAASSPLVVLSGLYFTHLRVRKQIGRLLLTSSIVAVTTLGAAVILAPRWGISASGVGWLVGNGVVAAIALGSAWIAAPRLGGR